jgi:hypothetical protein
MTAAWSTASGEPRGLPIQIPSVILCFKSGKEGWVIGRVAQKNKIRAKNKNGIKETA